ncbi:hypothetical protein LOTGIDRAFT_167661 [Lottia gigantea]|uniref:Uncharacterized protein n=1 Tax=Lottia gigantea TaxID=225164 RepID=V3Z5A9_LOTGI|nr:hypothetical protein LOTGIDRAFT_167661 [Lottia gigantea]ESO85903.1 hypothetical protein LOTGIDRAFT_167661 [Lottia gigantea]
MAIKVKVGIGVHGSKLVLEVKVFFSGNGNHQMRSDMHRDTAEIGIFSQEIYDSLLACGYGEFGRLLFGFIDIDLKNILVYGASYYFWCMLADNDIGDIDNTVLGYAGSNPAGSSSSVSCRDVLIEEWGKKYGTISQGM